MTIEERLESIERQLVALHSKIEALLQPTSPLSRKKEYLSKNEVAEKLGVSLTKIDRMMERREIPYYKIGGTVKFKAANLERWISAKERPAKKQLA